jgi:hypothetical protein
MPDYYHLHGGLLAPGSTILPGNYGRIIRAYGWQHNMAVRETATDTSALVGAPKIALGAPSAVSESWVSQNDLSSAGRRAALPVPHGLRSSQRRASRRLSDRQSHVRIKKGQAHLGIAGCPAHGKGQQPGLKLMFR